jgi:hypothetical protein
LRRESAVNCEQFRRALLINPYTRDPGFRAHVGRCGACARAAADALAFEHRLRAALADEVEEAGITRRPGAVVSARGWRPLLLAVFPLLLISVWIGLRGSAPAIDWERLVIDHIQTEPSHLRTAAPVPWRRVQVLLRGLGIEAPSWLGPVTYAGRCLIGPRPGIHLVVPGKRGAVTLLLLPGAVARREHRFAASGLAGVLVPAGFGNLAVVGRPGEALEPILDRFLAGVSRPSDDLGRSSADARRRTQPTAAGPDR